MTLRNQPHGCETAATAETRCSGKGSAATADSLLPKNCVWIGSRSTCFAQVFSLCSYYRGIKVTNSSRTKSEEETINNRTEARQFQEAILKIVISCYDANASAEIQPRAYNASQDHLMYIIVFFNNGFGPNEQDKNCIALRKRRRMTQEEFPRHFFHLLWIYLQTQVTKDSVDSEGCVSSVETWKVAWTWTDEIKLVQPIVSFKLHHSNKGPFHFVKAGQIVRWPINVRVANHFFLYDIF